MRGLLIYDNEGKRRNEWFIRRLTEAARLRGHSLELVIYPEELELSYAKDFDFAIVRTIRPDLNEKLEALGVPTFNASLTSRIANDKWQTYLSMRELGVSVMDTLLFTNYCEAAAIFGTPFVLKAVDGHGGSEVFLVENEHKCKELLSLLQNKRLIAQRLSSEAGVDMRVYVLGKEVLAAAKRTSDTDFRSNFSLGGKAEICTPDADVKKTVKAVAEALGCDFVGIDFIRHNGSWVLNEIEDVVGTRMLYALTDIDAADEYIGYIINKISLK